jgi:PAS domain S-box-containing protein
MKRVLHAFNSHSAPWIVLACSLVITALLWRAEENMVLLEAEDRFQHETREIESAIVERLLKYELMLQGCIGLFNSSGFVDRNEWKTYVHFLDPLKNYTGIQGIGFAKRVSAAEKQAHILQLRREGFSDYSIKPAGNRAEYFPIIYLEPFSERNLRAFSYDMFSEKVRRSAMEEARDRGVTIISGKVILVQETTEDVQNGVLMYLPLYEKNRPLSTVQERRAALRGFVYSPFRVNDFMKGIIPHDTGSIAWAVYDGNDAAGDSILYRSLDSKGLSPSRGKPLFEIKSTYALFGKSWTFTFKTLPEFEAAIDRTRLCIIVCFSLLVSVLLFTIAFLIVARGKILAAEIIRRERDQEALRESEERLRLLGDNIPESALYQYVHETDGSVRFMYFSAGIERLNGVSVQELLRDAGVLHRQILPEYYPQLVEAEAKSARDLSDFDSEVPMRRPDGQVRWMHLHSRPRRLPDGRVVWDGVQIDITERRLAEEELKKRTAQLEDANRELEAFSSSVSHDLQSPLRVINGYAAMILKRRGDDFDEDTRNKFSAIRASTLKMGRLIEDLLGFSRIGKQAMATAQLNMADLASEIWDELQVINQERTIALDIQDMPAAFGDRALIKQVYANLLGNAVKFTKYRDSARIEAGGYHDGSENIYFIRDNGAGFDMAWHNKLFGVFQRLHSEHEYEGTGMGLASVQRIINRHGGRVWAEGKEGVGATFYFTLPRQ